MDKWEGSQLNQAKEILAFELTKLVHDEEEASKAQESARALFGGGNAAEMPTAELTAADLTDGNIDILDLDVYKRQATLFIAPFVKKGSVRTVRIPRS